MKPRALLVLAVAILAGCDSSDDAPPPVPAETASALPGAIPPAGPAPEPPAEPERPVAAPERELESPPEPEPERRPETVEPEPVREPERVERPAEESPTPPPPGTRVAGRVNVGGLPGAGVTIELAGRAVPTDEEGRFEVRLAPGVHPIRFPSAATSTVLVVPDVAEYEVRFDLPGPAALAGRVDVLDLGLGSLRVLVYAIGGDEPLAEGTTDGRGRFRLTGLPEGPVRVVLLVRGRPLLEERLTLPRLDWRVELADRILPSKGRDR